MVAQGPGVRVRSSRSGSIFKKRNIVKHKNKHKNKEKKGSLRLANTAETKVIDRSAVQLKSLDYQAKWLTNVFHSTRVSSLSHLEDDPIPEDSLVQLSQQTDRAAENLVWHVKSMLGESWKNVLFNDSIKAKGSPALLIICSSASRCVELLKGLKDLTQEYKPAKLFAKHIKLEEQVKVLEGCVCIAAGTPNRVKKLIDIGALGLGCLSIVLLDMQEDAKGLTLFSIPQVKHDFWELYGDHFHQQVLNKNLKICLY